jgi:hypothetical protein
MKRLILSALVLGAATQAAGCIIVSDDDPVGDAQVTWDLLSADQNGNPIAAGCPQGATTATVFSLLEGADLSDSYIDKFDCVAGAGTAADLPTGRYQIWVRLTDTSESLLYAESGSLLADIADGLSTPVNHDIYVDHGFFTMSWQLLTPGGGRAACGQVNGEDGVSILASTSGGGMIDTVVDCESGDDPAIAITDPLPIGVDYTLSVALLNAQQVSIGTSDTIPPNPDRAIDYGNEFADLGVIDIHLDQ